MEHLAFQMTAASNMEKLADSYASLMPDWIKERFFSPDSERQSLVPLIGSLHISLNVKEDIMLAFRYFLNTSVKVCF